MLVGGLLDQTSSTLTQPDMDFSMQWGLGENLADCLYIRPTERGESGQYTLQVILSCHCQAQFKFSTSSVQFELRLALSLIITTPTHPGK